MERRTKKNLRGRGYGGGVADLPVEYLFNAALSIRVAVGN